MVERLLWFLCWPSLLPILDFRIYFGLIYVFFIGFCLQLSRLFISFGLFDIHNLELYGVNQMVETFIEFLLSQFFTLVILNCALHDFLYGLFLFQLLLELFLLSEFMLKNAFPHQFSLSFELSFLFSLLLVHLFQLLSRLFSVLLSFWFFLLYRHLLGHVELPVLVVFKQFPQFVFFICLKAAIFRCIFCGKSLLYNPFEITLDKFVWAHGFIQVWQIAFEFSQKLLPLCILLLAIRFFKVVFNLLGVQKRRFLFPIDIRFHVFYGFLGIVSLAAIIYQLFHWDRHALPKLVFFPWIGFEPAIQYWALASYFLRNRHAVGAQYVRITFFWRWGSAQNLRDLVGNLDE